MTDATTLRRFDIALSFPGEHRTFIEQVAEHLAAMFTPERVLYDKYHEEELARLDLNVYLPTLYRKESELIVVCLCPEYAAKLWCRLEWRHIGQLIATVDAKRIMFLSFGNPGDLSDLGILSGDGYINIDSLTPQTVAEKIRKRLNLNLGITPKAPVKTIRADISRIVRYAPSELVGREAETALLDDAWAKVQNHATPRPHVMTFVAMGGEGKTSLVAKWAAGLASKDWPGCEAVFAWSFYSQGSSEQNAASSDLFLAEALRFFGDEAMAGSAQGAFEKGKRLAQLVGERRALLILDGLEPLQYAPTSPLAGELKDQGVAALLKSLATTNNGLCVVTTRYAVPDLRAFVGNTVREEKLTRLLTAAGVELLQRLGVRGSLRKAFPAENPKWNEYETLVEEVKGHALTLHLLGSYLRDAHAGDIRQRDLIKLAEADAEVQGGHAFHVMDAYVRWLEGSEGAESSEYRLQAETGRSAEERAAGAQPPKGGTLNNGRRALALLQLLGLFDRPATADCLNALWQAPAIAGLTEPLIGLTEAQRNLSLKRLEEARLLTVNRDAAGKLLSLDAHPLLREYFAARVQRSGFSRSRAAEPPEGGTLNKAWREAHRRLYEHLCARTKEGDQPTLEDLQPLYQAVAHGCQAGLQQEVCEKVYRDRINRGARSGGFYATKKLGAFGSDLGAIAHFFKTPWGQVSHSLSEQTQIWLLAVAAYELQALGRSTEAIEPKRSSAEMAATQNDWYNAATGFSNLSELKMTLGDLVGAAGDAKKSVIYADRSRDMRWPYLSRVTDADVLHQLGHRVEAEQCFFEAQQIQAEHQPSYPLLYSLQGFKYCDLLLGVAEPAAWRMRNEEHKMQNDDLIEVCCAIYQRATRSLDWVTNHFTDLGDFDIAVEYLTRGRATLYQAILEDSDIENSKSDIEQAVSGLRRAGMQDHLPRGLLTRAWLRALTGALTGPDSAQEDLDEAWDIAERGSMKLFLADIHLHRARLFYREPSYPWQSPQDDLAAAEKLINECGYHRRDAELADAKQAILGQGLP